MSSVPERINRLTGCRGLNLGRCKLNRDDSFPDTLWQLTGLERLSLCGNNLTSIPSPIGQLSSLTFLSLGYNNLVSLPDEIYQLTNLTKLFLYDNLLESISEEIGNLTELTSLKLHGNQLKKLPKAIGKLINLQEPDEYNYEWPCISGNPLTSLPDSIRKVKHTLSKYSKKGYELLLEDVDTRAAQRLQRRLVILLAKEPPTQSTATKDKKISFINDILKDPKLVRLICEFVDWKPYPDDEEEDSNNNTIILHK